jgi:transposase
LHKLSLHSAKWIRELIHASVRTPCEPRFLHRLHCILLVAEDRSCYEVARWFGENSRTIQRWVRAFDKDGVESLRNHHSGGRRAKLANEQMQHLTADLLKLPSVSGYPERKWTGKFLAQHVERRYGVKLSVRQCQRIIRGLTRPKASVQATIMRQ